MRRIQVVGTAKGWAAHVARLFVLSAAAAAGGALSGANLDTAAADAPFVLVWGDKNCPLCDVSTTAPITFDLQRN